MEEPEERDEADDDENQENAQDAAMEKGDDKEDAQIVEKPAMVAGNKLTVVDDDGKDTEDEVQVSDVLLSMGDDFSKT